MVLLTGLKDQDKITQDQFRDLHRTYDLVPHQYGSPTIHKNGKQLHNMGSMAYVTLKAIADLLKPLVGKTIYPVKKYGPVQQSVERHANLLQGRWKGERAGVPKGHSH